MKYIVDGYNLIYRSGVIDECSGDIEKGRGRIEAVLRGYLASCKGVRVLIVYDSRHSIINLSRGSSGKLDIIFSAGDADSRIASMLENESTRGALTAVSSDREHVISSAKKSGADYMSSEAFWELVSRRKASQPEPAREGLRETTDWYKEILKKKGKLE